MDPVVTGTALAKCSFGAAPASLTVLPNQKACVVLPVATTADHAAVTNVPTFGMCTSLLNPSVLQATLMAFGALTPMPCMPKLVGSWLPRKPTVLVGGCPVLTKSSMAFCAYGGLVQLGLPGQMKATT